MTGPDSRDRAPRDRGHLKALAGASAEPNNGNEPEQDESSARANARRIAAPSGHEADLPATEQRATIASAGGEAGASHGSDPTAVDAPRGAQETELLAVKEALKSLFDRCGIDTAILVDDESYQVALADVTTLVRLHGEAARGALGVLGQGLNLDVEDIWREDLERAWETLSQSDKAAIVARLSALDGEVPHTHARFAASIRELLPVPCTVLSPEEWSASQEELVSARVSEPTTEGGRKKCRTLLLFDLDLQKVGLGPKGGATLVVNALQKFQGIDVLCGIVSSMVRTEAEGAPLDGAPPGFEPERVVRIAKGDVPDKPWQFAYGIKRAVLAPHVVDLRNEAKAIVAQAQDEAAKKLSEIEIYDVGYAVITRSDDEGVRESETLFRVQDIYYHDALRRLARKSLVLRTAADRMREILPLAEKAVRPADHRTWEIQRREIYDNVTDLNGLNLPLELGDVFACTRGDGATTEYVLLAPPCDLMVRKVKGLRRLEHGILVQISDVKPASDGGEAIASFELRYYLEGGRSAWVKFPKHFTVPLWVLDLCVYNRDGRARLTVGEGNPPDLDPSWGVHRSYVERMLKKSLSAYGPPVTANGAFKPRKSSEKRPGDTVEKAAPVAARTLTALPERILGYPFVKAQAVVAEPVEIQVECRRVQRVLRPYAADMLTKFGHYLSRAAFEVDLGVGTLGGSDRD